ncbi:energy-coupling factor transporter transmembrane component T family protein [Natrialba swarupiae]|uniref:Energy-coupling factor transporter transmembrane protein EcfT n=1 Tax=Natrialba swarupiae TaxID=2448032 RepID=A0A5D5AI92_9EURY|nr:energy-coupling factor transporter transmembrane component T [Natrialba swarupiae]TYT60537.1 energy-coupling factor transporter transmembrane protein EcfT [Natrialba swarupiae]
MSEKHTIYGTNLDDVLEEAEQPGNVIDYQPGDTFLHRLNPVTKLVISLGLITIAFLIPDFRVGLVLSVLLAMVVVVTGVYRPIAKVLAVIGIPLTVALVVIQGLFYPENQTPWYIFESVPVFEQIIVYEEGLLFALLILFRILVLMLALLGTIVTTHPKRLTIALMEKRMPSKLAYVFLAALQFIPQMRQRANAILDAQQARGLDTSANLWRRATSLVALLAPLLISMLISTETRALALESRGFAREGERTYLFDVPDTTFDRALRWLMFACVIAVAVWRVIL